MLDVINIFLGTWTIAVFVKYICQGKNSTAYEFEEQKLYFEFVKPMRLPYCLYAATMEIQTAIKGEHPIEMVIIVLAAVCLLRWAKRLEMRIILLQMEEAES